MPENETSSLLDYDELKMYFGSPYKVNEYLTINSPTVGEIVEYGERDYYAMIHMFTCIPSDMKSQLFDMGIDYEELSDFNLFIMLTKNFKKEQTKILFNDFDFSELKIQQDKISGKVRLYNPVNEQIIDELAYLKIVNYLRKMHNIKPKIEKAANKTTKKILIQLDRDKIKKAKNQPYTSQLKGLISAMMRYPGFKYKSNELKECTLYEFMDTVQGSQIYVNSTSLLQGSYSGMVDTSKINKKEFNWMRDISE